MQYVRFSVNEEPVQYGQVIGDSVFVLDQNFLDHPVRTDCSYPLSEVRLHAPVIGGTVFAAGLNYRDHVQEFDLSQAPEFPAFFVKLPHTVIGQHDAIVYPHQSNRVDYEAELGVVLGQDCFHVTAEQAQQAIFGFTCVNDVTARDLQRKDAQWTRSKNFSTFCPIGPWVQTETDGKGLHIECRVNGQVRQQGNTEDLIFSPAQLIALLSQVVPLKKGDILLTGTPGGIGPVFPGDIVEVEIEQIGILRNIVIKEREMQA